MPAGRLRHRVTLQKRNPDAVPNAFNEPADSWLDVLENVSAEVYAVGGREFVAAQQVQASVTHRVTLRKPTRVPIEQVQRFRWVEPLRTSTLIHLLDIKQVVPLQKYPGYVECLCTEQVSG